MTYRFQDKFDRADGDLGEGYLIPCGGVTISDQSVIPIDALEIVSGVSPLLGPTVTARKTQVLYSAEPMDGPNYVVRTTWAHDLVESSELAGVSSVPSFTIMARMSKDPLLFDLGAEEDPSCYDQGYGARVTFPLDSSAPILKIVKFMPLKRLPGLSRPSSNEVDGAVVLAQVTLDPDDLNLDSSFALSSYQTGDELPYRGLWQDMRLRIRRADNEVVLEVYLNDRNLNQPKIVHTDRRDPLWGDVGLPGFEFLSATLDPQPSGVSPFSLTGLSMLRCGIFSAETFLDVRRPVRVTPGSFYTYRHVTNRVITLVEKDGDARYNATTGGAQKFDTYLRFVIEAEADIIRKEGYFHWLRRQQRLYLVDGQDTYEMPEDLGALEIIRPGNWNAPPLQGTDRYRFYQRLGGSSRGSGGQPTIYTFVETGTNSRQQIRVFPTPSIKGIQLNESEDPFLEIDYFARQLFPDEPDVQIPFVPQEDMDVLIYAAAAHAMMLDTDSTNAQLFFGAYGAKIRDLRRKNNRQLTNALVMISAADFLASNVDTRLPLLRHQQLGSPLF